MPQNKLGDLSKVQESILGSRLVPQIKENVLTNVINTSYHTK